MKDSKLKSRETLDQDHSGSDADWKTREGFSKLPAESTDASDNEFEIYTQAELAQPVLRKDVCNIVQQKDQSHVDPQEQRKKSEALAKMQGFPRLGGQLTRDANDAWDHKARGLEVLESSLERCRGKHPETFEGSELERCGSAAERRCDLASSDTDLTLLLTKLSSTDEKKDEKKYVKALKKLRDEIPGRFSQADGCIVYNDILPGNVAVLRLQILKDKHQISFDVTINKQAAVDRRKKENERIEELMKINPFVPELLRIIRYYMEQQKLPGTQGGGPPSFSLREWALETLERMEREKKMKKLLKDPLEASNCHAIFTTFLRRFFNSRLLEKKLSHPEFNPFRSESRLADGVKLEYARIFFWASEELEKLQGKESTDKTLESLCLDKPPVEPQGNDWVAMDPRKKTVYLIRSKGDIVRAGKKSSTDVEAVQLWHQDGEVVEIGPLNIKGSNAIRQVDPTSGEGAEWIEWTVLTLRQQDREKSELVTAQYHAGAHKLQPVEPASQLLAYTPKVEPDKTVRTAAIGSRHADGLVRFLHVVVDWANKDKFLAKNPNPVDFENALLRRKILQEFFKGQLLPRGVWSKRMAEKWGQCVACNEMFPASKHHDKPKEDSLGQVILLAAQLLVDDGESALLLTDFQINRNTNKIHPAYVRDLVIGCIIEFSLNAYFKAAKNYKYACLAFPANCQTILDELFAGKCEATKEEQVRSEVPILKEGWALKFVEWQEVDNVASSMKATTPPVKAKDFQPFKDSFGSVVYQDHGLLAIIEGATTHDSYNGKFAVVLGIHDSETYCRAFLPDSLKVIDCRVDWLSHPGKHHVKLKPEVQLKKLGLQDASLEHFKAVQDRVFLQKILPVDKLKAEVADPHSHLFPETSKWQDTPEATAFVAVSKWGSAETEIFVVPKDFLEELDSVPAKASSKFKIYPSVKVESNVNCDKMRQFQAKISKWLDEKNYLQSVQTDASETARLAAQEEMAEASWLIHEGIY
eukprot:s2142_g10.t2